MPVKNSNRVVKCDVTKRFLSEILELFQEIEHDALSEYASRF